MKIKVRYRKLGRHASKDESRIYGLSWGYVQNGKWTSNGLIEIDPRQSERKEMDTVAHELLHHEYPDLSEEAVERGAATITAVFWKLGFRKGK